MAERAEGLEGREIENSGGRDSREAGQAAPIYITMVAALLFLALAFFAVGQAGATRNGAQSAADAAALAAAQESRDQFRLDLLANLLQPGYLDDIFNGNPLGTYNGCVAAGRFAEENDADVDVPEGGCGWTGDGRWGFTVHVVTKETMGDSVLGDEADEKARAHATAVVEPRCSFKPAEEDEGSDEGSEEPDEGDEGDEGEEEPVSPGELDCDGKGLVTIDPKNPVLPDMSVLFSVRLAED
ncbi:pilus assembly protein TadG-related protein [Streptomyces sp. NPDC058665]|uniref:pilus assembly protein TadG-related protein n=1 Tax=Streptomyces sp. NPDC058665 TaxID=3346586 RepID=UPI003662A79B